jgi:hypothetical protein
MELIRFELRAWDPVNFVGMVVCLVGLLVVLTAILCVRETATYIVGAPIAALFALACCGYIYRFVTNPKCEFAVRDNAIWWDSPGWRRSAGTIPIAEMSKVRILEGPDKLDILMRDGTSRSVPCLAVCRNGDGRKLQDVLVANYPDVTVELVED